MIGNLESKPLKRNGLKGHLPESSSSSSSSSSASRRLLRLSADKIVLKGKLINKNYY